MGWRSDISFFRPKFRLWIFVHELEILIRKISSCGIEFFQEHIWLIFEDDQTLQNEPFIYFERPTFIVSNCVFLAGINVQYNVLSIRFYINWASFKKSLLISWNISKTHLRYCETMYFFDSILSKCYSIIFDL